MKIMQFFPDTLNLTMSLIAALTKRSLLLPATDSPEKLSSQVL